MKLNIKKKIKNLPYYIITEIGMNHDGVFNDALKLTKAAKGSEVNAVKFQMHIAEEETLKNAPPPPYFKSESRFDFFKRTAFSENQWRNLKNYCHKLGLDFIVSPFSIKAAETLKKIKVDAYKIASGEVTNHPLLEYIAKTKIPVLMSSGMSDWQEIDNAIKILKNNLLVLFQCSSEYPCAPESVGLNVIEDMRKKYPNLIIGFSDHTLDNFSAIAVFMKGAKVFEKHFTLSKNAYGPDAKFSLEPKEMKKFVEGIEFIDKALKYKVNKNDLTKYKEMKSIFEKSIVATKDLKKGEMLRLIDLNFKKPGNGIKANKYKNLIGKKLIKNKLKDEKITYGDIKKV